PAGRFGTIMVVIADFPILQRPGGWSLPGRCCFQFSVLVSVTAPVVSSAGWVASLRRARSISSRASGGTTAPRSALGSIRTSVSLGACGSGDTYRLLPLARVGSASQAFLDGAGQDTDGGRGGAGRPLSVVQGHEQPPQGQVTQAKVGGAGSVGLHAPMLKG